MLGPHSQEVGRNRQLAEDLAQWIIVGMKPFSSAEEFRRSLAGEGEMRLLAMQLEERLHLAARVAEVLPSSLAEWIEAGRKASV